MAWVLRTLGLARLGVIDLDGPPSYVKSYDVDYEPLPFQYLRLPRHRTGVCDLTDDLAEALRFPTKEAAFAAWRQQSTVMPLRPDGKPNRPLTAYSMTIEEVEP